jgi:hypothetical protein
MANCKFCGEKAGWFSDAHENCAETAQAGANEIEIIISDAAKKIGQGGETPNVGPSIDQVIAQKKVPLEAVNAAIIEGWSKSASEIALREPLPSDKQLALLHLYQQLGFTNEGMRKTNGFAAVNLSAVLWALINDVRELYDGTMVSRNPFNLKAGEIPIAFFASVSYSQETSARSYEGGYGGLSVRLAPGVYSHFGGFKGHRIEQREMKEIDYSGNGNGGMLLTTQAIYYGGDHTTFRIPFDHVISFHAREDGIGLSRNVGQGRPEVFSIVVLGANNAPTPAPSVYGWFLFNATRFLATKMR